MPFLLICSRPHPHQGQVPRCLLRPPAAGAGEGVPLQQVHHHQEEGGAGQQRGPIRETGENSKTSKSIHTPAFPSSMPEPSAARAGKKLLEACMLRGDIPLSLPPPRQGKEPQMTKTHIAPPRKKHVAALKTANTYTSISQKVSSCGDGWKERERGGGGCVFLSCRRRFLSVSCLL